MAVPKFVLISDFDISASSFPPAGPDIVSAPTLTIVVGVLLPVLVGILTEEDLFVEEPKFEYGQLVVIVPPSEAEDREGFRHLMALQGQTATIEGTVTAGFGDDASALYYIKLSGSRKTLAPENWLQPFRK